MGGESLGRRYRSYCTGTEGAIPQKLSGTRTHSCEHSGKWHGSVHRRGTSGLVMVWAMINLSGSVTEGALPMEIGYAVFCEETEEILVGKSSNLSL